MSDDLLGGILLGLAGVGIVLARNFFAGSMVRLMQGLDFKNTPDPASAKRMFSYGMAGFGTVVVIVGVVFALRALPA